MANRSKPPSKKKTLRGSVSITSRGFGFVTQDSGPDIFVSYDNLGTAMDGDTAEVELLSSRGKGKPSGKVVSVVSRSQEPIVGVYKKTRAGGFVYPENERLLSKLFIPKNALKEEGLQRRLKNGHVVVSHLVEWENRESTPEGRITEILGSQDESDIDAKAVAASYGLSHGFPQEVRKEASEAARQKVEEQLPHRRDLRDLTIFTIDPESARDFDDALSIEVLDEGGFRVGVHIADVSHFVPEGSALDTEAEERGTSVYLIDSVVPMLPEELSNGICSLVPDEDRLAYSVFINLTGLGQVRSSEIVESVIRSKARMTYQEAADVLSGRKNGRYQRELHLLAALSQVLLKGRQEEGSIDFDVAQKRIVLDEDGVPQRIKPEVRLPSMRLVEEFMLLANRVVARRIAQLEQSWKMDLPFVYRVHDRPKEDEFKSLLSILDALGIPFNVSEPVNPEDYRRLLAFVSGGEYGPFLERVALYTMTKAIYDTKNRGHFGLAFDEYTHFTSPIRRYPDLVVHRLLKRYQAHGKPKKTDSLEKALENICSRSTQAEIAATNAEREYAKLKSLEFLANKIGQTYAGIVSGVTSFGLFVEVTRYGIEGLVPLEKLPEKNLSFNKQQHELTDAQGSTAYRLGDRLRVRIDAVEPSERRATFSLA